jgi:hypothetical protein
MQEHRSSMHTTHLSSDAPRLSSCLDNTSLFEFEPSRVERFVHMLIDPNSEPDLSIFSLLPVFPTEFPSAGLGLHIMSLSPLSSRVLVFSSERETERFLNFGDSSLDLAVILVGQDRQRLEIGKEARETRQDIRGDKLMMNLERREMRLDRARLGKENMAGIRICPRQDKARQDEMR